jgi:hypothetical protein
MKKILLTLTIIVMVQSLFVGIAGAEYLKKYDKKVSINTGLNLSIPLNTGEKSYKLQEQTHDTLNKTTGVELDYYYIWLEVDGQPVLAIDPARAMF